MLSHSYEAPSSCLVMASNIALIGFRGAYAPVLSEKRNSFSGLLKNKGSKEESKTKVGLDAIDTSTTLASNKSLSR